MIDKVIVSDKDDIMIRYLDMRKIAISYWNYFSFFFGNLLILPLVQRTRIKRPTFQILASCYLSYEFYRFTLKYFVRTFNNKEYNLYKDFCLKYQMQDDTLL